MSPRVLILSLALGSDLNDVPFAPRHLLLWPLRGAPVTLQNPLPRDTQWSPSLAIFQVQKGLAAAVN